jgi:ABC-type transporter Mla subunit MlaD
VLHHLAIWAVEPGSGTSSGFGLNLGTLLSGIAALLIALGSGLGAFFKYRRSAKRIKMSADAAAIKRIQDAADHLTEQYEERIDQYKETIERQDRAYDEQRHLYEDRLNNLQSLNATLLEQILDRHGHDHRDEH